MTNKQWKRLLGWEPDKETKEMILQTVQDEKITIEEATGRMALPPVFIEGINEPNPDEYDNNFRPAVFIKRHKNINEKDRT